MQKQLAIKLAVIGLLALLLLIPLAMIEGKINERRNFERVARSGVAASWTGPQTLLTPVLLQPVTVEINRLVGKDNNGDDIFRMTRINQQRLLIPDSLHVESEAKMERRFQGIYGIPVYSKQFTLRGRFDEARLKQFIHKLNSSPEIVEIGQPYLALAVSDMRGIMAAPQLRWQGELIDFEPGSGIKGIPGGLQASVPALKDGSNREFIVNLGLRGMESIHIIPAARQLSATMNAPWPDPSFSGAFLPQEHSIERSGFNARWQLNHFSTGIEQLAAQCEQGDCEALQKIAFGVNFIEGVDNYLQSERSLKYGILFIGLSFVSFFVFEMLRGLPIHPLQYALVGFALAVFFLLLTSLSEHLNFGMSYLISASACLALLTYYLRFVLSQWRAALGFNFGLGALYGLLYVIVQAEDFALIMGSALIFAVLTGVMVFTRNIDWYAVAKPKRVVQSSTA